MAGVKVVSEWLKFRKQGSSICELKEAEWTGLESVSRVTL